MDTNPLDKLRGAGYNQAKTVTSQPPSDAPQDTPLVQPVTTPPSSRPSFVPPPETSIPQQSNTLNPPDSSNLSIPSDLSDSSGFSDPSDSSDSTDLSDTSDTSGSSDPSDSSDSSEPPPDQPESENPAALQNPFLSDEKKPQKDSRLPEVKVKLDLAFLKAKYVVLFLAIATGIAGSALAIYSYQKLNSSNTLGAQVITDSERLSEKEIKALKEKVSLIAVLPENEIPVVLPITDLTKLHSNEFFKDAKLKDKIIIFKQAGRIVIYDPINNKIVNMGPYSETQTQIIPTPTPLPTPTPEATASPTLKKPKKS